MNTSVNTGTTNRIVPQYKYLTSLLSKKHLIEAPKDTTIVVRATFFPLLYNLFQEGNGSDEDKIDGTLTKLIVVPSPANIPDENLNNLSIFS
jgi:hypothetical protein